MYKKRWLADELRKYIDVNPVLVITGARQTGKSTLLLNEEPFKKWRYFSLDDLDTLEVAIKDPDKLLSIPENIVIDEVQKAPNLLHSVKKAVDKSRERKIVLSGSSNLLLMRQVSETLAGRATYFILYPFTLGEWFGLKPVEWIFKIFDGNFPDPDLEVQPMDPVDHLLRGFLPPVLLIERQESATKWWESYVKTYLERDLRELSRIVYLVDFRNLMELIALRSASILVETDLANSLDISQPTVHRYINLLEASNLFIRLRAYAKGKTVRIVKSPKGFYLDPGLAAYLAGVHSKDDLNDEFMGKLFETLVMLHLKVIVSLKGGELYYWRTIGGRAREIDFVIEYKGKLVGVEVKCSKSLGYRDVKILKNFLEIYPNAVAGIVLYMGTQVKYFAERILAVPWTALVYDI